MKFLILASLFVLSVVANPEAEAEAEPQHFTFGLVQHPNGAITPDDTDSVKAVKALHANAKLDAYAFNYAKGFSHMPNVYQNDYMPKVYQNDYMRPEVYSGRYYNNYYSGMPTYATNPFYHVYQPQVFGSVHRTPAVHGLGKRDAEADAEADSEAESHYYHSYSRPSTYFPSSYRYPYANRFAGYPYTYPKDANTYMENAMPLRQALQALKRPVVFRTNFQSYDPYPARSEFYRRQSAVQSQFGQSGVQSQFEHRRFVREAESEAEAQYSYYYGQTYPNTYATYANTYNGFPNSWSNVHNVYTPYAMTTYAGYPYSTYNTYNGFYRF